jgi:hypothetical protein
VSGVCVLAIYLRRIGKLGRLFFDDCNDYLMKMKTILFMKFNDVVCTNTSSSGSSSLPRNICSNIAREIT